MGTVKRTRALSVARLLKLVASRTRAGIVLALSEKKEMPVREIADELRMTHSAVSHQLAVLAKAGIVTYKKVGREVYYALASEKRARLLARFMSSI